MSIVGTLLPEQVDFFTKHDLAGIADSFTDFVAPFHIYVDGKFVRSRDDVSIYAITEIGQELDEQNPTARIVILDDLGQLAYTVHYKPATPGSFHLVYSVEAKDCAGLWEFFEDTRNDLVNADDSGVSVWTIAAGELADTVFDEDDFFINDAPHQRGLHTSLKEYVLNLQEIARLYPLLEIKIYR